MKKREGIPPISVSETSWLYSERKGVAVVQEERDANGKLVCVLQALVPWSALDEAYEQRPPNPLMEKPAKESRHDMATAPRHRSRA